MRLRKLLPFAVTLVLATGCQRHVAQAANTSVPSTPAPFATPPVLAGTPDVATLVAKVKPAVVNITTTHEIRAPRLDSESPFGFDFFGHGPFQGQGAPFLRRGRGSEGRGGEQVLKQHALGSGFVIDPQGHVVTNAHVVDGADVVQVKLADDREFEAKVKGRDERLDLAVLELQGAKDLPAASLGSSEALRVGEYVVAIGNPFGLGDTVTMGIVSAKSRTIGAGPYDDFIQTDASINPGNSGGPLFNLRGQVIGINTAINPNGKGIGFAIPSDTLKDVLPQLLSSGHVTRGRLGVAIQSVDAPLAKALGLDHPKGALVGDVESATPAEKAGLHAGDVIVGVDSDDVAHAQDLPRMIARHAPGTHVALKVLRDGKPVTFDVTLDALRDEASEQGRDGDTGDGHDSSAPAAGLGIGVGDSPDGVTVERILPGGAAEGHLQPGDVIVEVNRAAVGHAADLAKRIQSTPAGEPVLLKVRREGKTRFVAIERH
jgi:serine protease Do